ncbi:MAG: hypothetical protein K2M98_05555 [Muribaculum sp.]|nr:hypothetical protein [Muribaculum sp.]
MIVRQYIISLLCTTALSLIASGCSGHTPQPSHGHLSGGNDDPTEEVYDFTPELRDNETRYTSDNGIRLRYSQGGILVINDKESDCISLIDLASSHRIDFYAQQPFSEGLMPRATLTVDGHKVETSAIKCEHLTSTAVWISILTSDNNHAVLVLSNDN